MTNYKNGEIKMTNSEFITDEIAFNGISIYRGRVIMRFQPKYPSIDNCRPFYKMYKNIIKYAMDSDRFEPGTMVNQSIELGYQRQLENQFFSGRYYFTKLEIFIIDTAYKRSEKKTRKLYKILYNGPRGRYA